MPISIQAMKEFMEGSETRTYRPEREMKSVGEASVLRSALHPTE